MPSEQDAVGRVRAAVEREDKLNAKLSIPIGHEDEFVHETAEVRWSDLRALLARVETLEAAHRTLKLGLVESLGPCAPEHDGTDALDAVRRIVAEVARLQRDPSPARLPGDATG